MPRLGPRSGVLGAGWRALAIAFLTWFGAVTCVLWFCVVLILWDFARGADARPELSIPALAFFALWIGTGLSVWFVLPACVCLWRRRLLTSALFVWVLALGSVTGVQLGVGLLSDASGFWALIAIPEGVVLLGLAFVAFDPFRVWRLEEPASRGGSASGTQTFAARESSDHPESGARGDAPRAVTP